MRKSWAVAGQALSVLIALSAAKTHAQLVTPKTAKAGDVVPTWGKVVDPDGDTKVFPGVKSLSIVVPRTPHDLDGPKRNAPRLMRDVQGDFSIMVRVPDMPYPFHSSPPPGETPYQSAGLLAWQDESHFLRLEWVGLLEHRPPGEPPQPRGRGSAGRAGTPKFVIRAQCVDGKEIVTEDIPGEDREVWLRMVRKGKSVRAEFSADGKKWTKAKEFDVNWTPKLDVGISASNTAMNGYPARFAGLAVGKPDP